MIRRVALILPLAFALGCGAAAPPPAAPPAGGEAAAPSAQPATEGAPEAKKMGAAPATGGQPAEPAPAPGKAAVTPTDAPLTSTITQDEVLNQVGKASDVFNRCYQIGAAGTKNWRAKITVKATVGPNGNVGSAEVVKSTSKNPKVDACVVEGFKKLVFPRPKGSGATTFTFPLSFDGVEQVQ